MDAKVVSFYRTIYADLKIDNEEAKELKDFLESVHPPPDKIVWMRATAFRIASEFLTDDKNKNVSLLRTLNYIVHSIEAYCLQPKALANAGPVDAAVVSDFYKSLFDDLTVDREENAELFQFFQSKSPPDQASLVQTRALAFKVGVDFLAESKETNIQLLRCINVIVHAFEKSCLEPKPFKMKEEPMNLHMSLADAAQHLWELDENRLDPERDYSINVQKGKKPYWKGDNADEPLFSYVNERELRRRTYSTFIALLDNYCAETGTREVVTSHEKRENWAFLNAVMETKPMQFCHRYCHAKKPHDVPRDPSDFKKLLNQLWFELYRRERSNDSSGFEHVFVGEIRDGKISGFHNWIRFYLEEKKGTVDYRGYIKPRSRTEALADEHDQLLTIQFTWNGVEKTVGSSFIGTSPEFELALYTMCFLLGEEKNEVRIATGGVENDTFDVSITCYKMAGSKVGTCFPEIKNHFED